MLEGADARFHSIMHAHQPSGVRGHAVVLAVISVFLALGVIVLLGLEPYILRWWSPLKTMFFARHPFSYQGTPF
jgi:hypothetical protein